MIMSYAGSGYGCELAAGRISIHPEIVQHHRPLLTPRLGDLDAPYQPVRAVDPDHRCAVRLIVLLGRERDHVRRPAAERVHAAVPRDVALRRVLHGLAGEVPPGRS